MHKGWFFFTPAADGFDIIVRDQGATNGPVIAEGGIRGKDFEKFANEVLFEGLSKMNLPTPEPCEKITSTSEDWVGEPGPEGS